MRISELNIYPVKSARGIPLSASAVDAFGLTGDRVAMLVKPDGMFITQREMPALARLNVHPEGDGLVLSYDGRDGSVHAVRPENGRRQAVEVWKTPVDAAICDDAVNAALSDWLGQPVQLAVFDGASHRTASEDWAASETPVRFADGYQILVTTTASLAALNENMAANDEAPVGMDRFRPNIVIDGAEAWGEDRWAAIEIGGIRFDLVTLHHDHAGPAHRLARGGQSDAGHGTAAHVGGPARAGAAVRLERRATRQRPHRGRRCGARSRWAAGRLGAEAARLEHFQEKCETAFRPEMR